MTMLEREQLRLDAVTAASQAIERSDEPLIVIGALCRILYETFMDDVTLNNGDVAIMAAHIEELTDNAIKQSDEATNALNALYRDASAACEALKHQ